MRGNNTTPPIHVDLAQHPTKMGRGRGLSQIQFVSNESFPCEEAMNHMANCRIIKLLWWNLRPVHNALLQPCDILRTMTILTQCFSFRRKFVLASNLVSYGTISWQAHGKFIIYIIMWVWRFYNANPYLFRQIVFVLLCFVLFILFFPSSEGGGSAILKSLRLCSLTPTSPYHRYYVLISPLSSCIQL